MQPGDDSLDQSYEGSQFDSSLEAGSTKVQVEPTGQSVQPQRFSPRRLNRSALVITVVALLVITVVGVGTLLLSSHTKKPATQGTSLASKYAVGNLSLQNVKGVNLDVGTADFLAINGELQANNTLVITPGVRPTEPTTGQLYYDASTNQPYYYDGNNFVSLGQVITQYVSNVGGASGAIPLGPGLQISNGTLRVTSSIINGSNGGRVVTSLQGLTGDINLVAGTGITISGTTISNGGITSLNAGNGISVSGNTISNSGVTALTSNDGSVAITPNGSGSFDLSVVNGGPGTTAVLLSPPAAQVDPNNLSSVHINKTGNGDFLEFANNGTDTFVVDQTGKIVAGTIDYSQVLNRPASTVTDINGTSGSIALGSGLGIAGGTLSNTGVTSITGTANQVNASAATGAVTLSLPQDIAATSTPTFGGLTLNGALTVNAGSTFNGSVSVSGANTFSTGTGTVTIGSLGAGLVQSSAGGVLSSGAVDRNSAVFFSNALTVANGGTGATTFTSNGLLYGNGAGAIQATGSANNSVLATNGSGTPGLTQTLPAAVQANITQTGIVTAGSISSGFGTISTTNNITTTAALQGATLSVAAGSFTVDGSGNIVTTGTAAIQGAGGVTIGVAGTTAGSLVFANTSNAHFTTLQGLAPAGQNQTITIPASSAVTDTVCLLTLANCAGSGGGVTASGGTQNFITKFTNAGGTQIGNSLLFDNGTSVGVGTSSPGAGFVLDVNGNVNTSSNLSLTGTGTLSSGTGAVSLNGNTTVTGSKTFTVGTGATSLGGTLGVTGATTLSSTLTVNGVSTLNGNLSVTGTNTLTTGTGTVTLGSLGAGLVQSSAGGVLSSGAVDRNSATFFSNALTVANGGTGATSLTANGILYGNGTGSIQATSSANNSVLATNGSGTPALTQTLPTAVQANITQTGALASGSIASGFGTISTTNSISTTAALQGGTLNIAAGILTVDASGNVVTVGSAAIQGAGGVSIGVAGTTAGSLVFANASNAHFTTLQGLAPAGQDQTITIPASSAATDTVCLLTLANCVGTGGGVTSSGGTQNFITKFTNAGGTQIGNSLLFDNGTSVGVGTSSPSASYLLDINGNVNTSGNLNQTGTGTFTTGSGAVTLNGATSISGTNTLTVGTGATSLGGTLGVTGLSTLSGGANIAGLTVTSSATITGTTNINTTGGSATSIGTASANFSLASAGLNVTTAGALSGITTISASGAITAASSGNTINGLIINSGALTGVAGITTSGGYTQSGSSTNTLTGATTIQNTLAVQGSSVTIGVAGTTTGNLDLANSSSTRLVQVQGLNPTGTGNATLQIPSIAGSSTDTFCLLNLGNCAGSPNAVTTTSNGTVNTIPVFTGAHTIANSDITDDGTTVTVGVTLSAATISTTLIQSSGALTITPGGNLTIGATNHATTLQGSASSTFAATSGANTTTFGFTAPTANRTINLPDESGTVCLESSTNCGFAASGSGVTSVDGLAGALTLANSSGSGTTITINNASTAAKGIAQFNASDFSVAAGVVDTIQPITTTAAVTFGSLTLGSGGNLTLSATGSVVANTITHTGTGHNIMLDAGADNVTFSNSSGANTFLFPTTGGTGQVICTSGITCASGGGQAVILEPSGVQTANGNLTSVFINKQSGTGNLIELQTSGSDAFVIDNTGNTTISNTTTISALQTNSITPTAALTIGATSQNFTIQGNTGSVVTSSDGTFTTSLGFRFGTGGSAPTGNITYQLPNDSTVAPGTYDICTTAGNCAGTGGGVTTAGGTVNHLSKFTSASNIADSIVTDDGTTVTVGGNLAVGVSGGSQLSVGVASSADGTVVLYNSTNSNTLTLQQVATAPSGNIVQKFPDQGGTFAVSAAGPISLDATTGQISCSTCLTSGGGAGGGVSSITGTTAGSSAINGALTLNNALTSGTTITLDNAKADASTKGIATFNATNFTDNGSGTINTIQNIATTSSPTFANLTVNGSTGLTLGSASNVGQLIFKDGTADGFTSTFTQATLTVSNKTITVPNASGTLAVSASGNLSLSALGNLTIVNNPTFTTSVTTPSLLGSSGLTINPNGGALTVGATSQAFTVQGTSGSTFTATSGANTTTVGFTTPTAARSINFPDAGGTICTDSGNCLGGSGAANTHLSNLSSVAINTTLLPGVAAGVDLGSGSLPFGQLYIAGSSATPATNNFLITGASTGGTRTVTLPDASGTVCYQNAAACGFEATTGTDFIKNQTGQQTGANFNIQARSSSVAATIQGASGQDIIDLVNSSNATVAKIDASGNLTAVGGTFSGNVSITGSSTLTTGTGTVTLGSLGSGLVQSNGSGVLSSGAVDRNSSTFFNTTLTVANGGTGAGTFTANGIIYGNTTGALQVTAAAANSVLATNGSNTPSLSQTLPTAVQGNITQTGALTAGSIASGFGTIATGNAISTTAALSGGTFAAGSSGQLTIDGSGNLVTSGTAGITGALTLGNDAASPTQGSIIFNDNTGANAHTFTLKTAATISLNTTVTLPDPGVATDTVCLQTLANCSGGGTAFINNSTSQQTGANFNIQARAATVAAVIQGAASQDIIDFVNSANSTVAKIDASGNLTAVGGTFNGNVSITGSGTFTSGSGAVTLNGATSISGTNTLTVGTGLTSLGGGLSVTAGLTTLSGGATITGTTNINTSGSAATSIGTASGNFSLASAGLNVTTAGALSGITTIGLSGAISGATSGNTINGLVINGGALSSVTGITTSGSYTQSGSGANTFSGASSFTAAGTGLSVTNNATVGGTFNVTGTTTQVGALTLGNDAASPTQGQLVFNDNTGSNAHTLTLQSSAAVGQNTTITLPDPGAGSATVCYQNASACGFATSSGSSSYIQNGTSVQTNANYYIRSAAVGSVGAVVEGANGQTADLLRLNTFNGTTSSTVAKFDASGNLTAVGGTFTALGSGLVQSSAGGVLSSGAVDRNSSTFFNTTLTVANGGTGTATTPTNGQLLIGNGTNYTVATLGTTGLTATTGAGSLSLAVNYGSAANTAVQGNTTLVCPSASGNASLSGTGNTITLGSGGTCNAISLSNTPSFTSVTATGSGPSLIANGAPAASATSSLLQLGNAIASGNAVANGGTYLGLNEPSSGAGSAADFLNFQANGVSKVKIDNTGTLTLGSLGAGLVQSSAGGVLSSGAVDRNSATFFNTTLSVANGGTGAGTFTADGIVYGSGTSALQVTAAAANSVLVTNGSNVPSLSQTLPTAVQGNITQTGALTAGSIASGFGTISTTNNITTTAQIQGGTFQNTGASFAVNSSGNVTAALSGTTGATLVCQNASNQLAGCTNSYETTTGTDFIRNQTSQQTSANFNIASAASTSVGAVIQGAASQTADLLDLRDSTGANVLGVSATGNQETTGYYDNGIGGIGPFGNLLTFSEQLDNAAWTATNVTVTANDAGSNPAPDSLTSAEKLVSTAGNGTVKQSVAGGNNTYTFSIWVKTNSGTQPVQLRIDSNGTPASGTAASFTATTTWQRFSVTQTFTSGVTTVTPTLIITNNAATVAAWGGQLVQAATAQVYVRTTTSTVAASTGVVSNGGVFISARNASDNPLVIQGAPSQAGDLLQLQNSSGTVLAKVDSAGNLTAVAGSFSGTLGTTSNLNVGSSNQFQVTNTGNVSTSGTLSVTGTSTLVGALTLGNDAASPVQGQIIFNDPTGSNGRTLTLQVATQTVGSSTVSLPNTAGVSDTVCLLTLANCVGTGGGVTASGGVSGAIAKFTGATTLTSSGLSESGSALTYTGTLAVQGATVTIGTSSQTGSLVLNDGSTHTTTLQPGVSAANQTIILPTSLGSANQCVKNTGTAGTLTFANCNNGSGSGGSITLQDTYDASSTPASILLATGKDLVVTSPDVATDPNVLFNLQCTTCSASGGRFAVQNGGSDVFTVNPNSGGVITKVTSTTAFEVQSAGSTNVLVVDTSGQKVAVGPSAVAANGALTVGTNTTAASGGIYLGTDTNLYRQAAGVLQTDGALNVLGSSGIAVGASGSTAGSLKLFAGSDTSSLTFKTSALGAGNNFNLTAPAITANDTLCTVNLANCTPAAGSGNYIQNTFVVQTAANFYIRSAGTNRVGGVIEGANGQTADLLDLNKFNGTTSSVLSSFNSNGDLTIGGTNSASSTTALKVQNTSGLAVATVDTTNGQLVLGRVAASGTGLAGKLAFADGTTDNFSATLQSATLTASRTITLPDATGTVCLQNAAACGFATSSGSGSYIQNGTTVQTSASFYIQPTSGNVAGVIKANGAGDLLDFQNSSANVLTKFNSNGDLLIGGTNSASSVTALQIQNTSATSVLNVDTTNSITTLSGINSNASVGAELLTGNCSGTNWSGTGSGPYTHASGSTADLTCTITGGVTNGATYRVSFATAPSSGATTITPTIGGVSGPATTGTVNPMVDVITTAGTTNPAFTISSAVDTGTISSISFKLVTLSNAALQVKNSGGVVALEVRGSGNTSNTYIGLQAGQASTSTASLNTAVGYLAFQSNTTGGSNTSIGTQSLQNNTTGNQNTALGVQSLQNNTTGTQSTAVGYRSLLNNTTGGFNIAVGSTALQSNTTGSDNTALGYQALTSNTTGNFNTALGYTALKNNTGLDNTAVGANALLSNTGGSFDTAFGYNAGYQDPNVATFATLPNLQNATALGYGAQVQQSNSLILGGVGTTASNNTPNIGIGTTAPTNLLSVSPNTYDTGTAGTGGVLTATVTGVGTTWTSAMVGDEFIFQDGTKQTITAVASTTSLTLAAAVQENAGQNYRIHLPALQVTSTGNVGIGTAAPTSLLDVRTANTGQVTITSDLSYGARASYPLVITQANNATNDNSAGLLSLTNSDTGSTAALLNISQVSNGTGINISGTTSGTAILLSSGASIASAAGINLSLQSGTTGTVTIDSGTTGAISIGTNANSKNLSIGSTTGGTTTLQSGGGVTVSQALTLSTLGTTNTATYLCRNGSNIIAACQTTASGTAFVQGGNSFGATGVLGTLDANGLQFVTGTSGPNGRAFFDTANNLILGNATATTGTATPNAFSVLGSASSAAGTAGAQLTIKGGAGATATTGSAGGNLILQGGDAGGSGGNNGGTLQLDSGAKTGAGTSSINLGITNATAITIGNTTGSTNTIQSSAAGTAITIGNVTSGTAINSNTITTGTVLGGTGLTTGTGLNLGGTNTTTATGLLFNTTSLTATTEGALNVTGTASGALSAYTGNLINVAPTRTLTGATITDTGSLLKLARTNSVTSANTFTVQGAVASLSSTCSTSGGGTCTDTSNILSLNQQYANASGAVALIQNNGTGNALQIQDGSSNVNALFNNVGNQLTLGRIAASGTVTQGKLVLSDGTTDNRSVTLQTAALTVGSAMITIPDTAGAGGTVCLQSSAACGFATSATGAAAFVQGGNSFGATATLGTNDNNGLNIRTNGTTVASLSNTGAATFQNASNSTTAFQIQNTAGTSNLLVADTLNSRIGIGTAGPSSALDVRFANQVVNNGAATGAVYLGTTDSLAADKGGSLLLGGSSGDSAKIAFGSIAGRKENGTSANYAGYLQFATNQASGTMAEWMRITSTGLVGIGTTNPSALLSVGSTSQFQVSNTGAITTSSTYNTNTFNSSTLTFGAAGTATISAAASQTLSLQGPSSVSVGSSGGGVTLTAAASSFVQIDTSGAGSINIGNTNSGAKTISIGATGASAFTSTIGIGTATGASQAITIGSTNSGSTVTLQGGASTLTIQNANLQVNNLVQPNANNTIDLGVVTTNAFRTGYFGTSLNVAGTTLNSTTLSFTGTGTVQSASGTALAITAQGSGALNLSSGTGNINLTTNSSSASITAKTSTNSATAFQVQNASGVNALQVDTTITQSSNLVTNPDFEINTTGWGATGTGASITRTTTSANIYRGTGALDVTLGTASPSGAQITSSGLSGSALTPGTYTLSFYAMGGAALSGLAVSFTGGTITQACTLNSFSVVTTGFTRYYCTFIFTTSNITAISITSTTLSQHMYLDDVQVASGSNVLPQYTNALEFGGVVDDPTLFKNTNDSTTAFQVQNSAGTSNALIVDTLNSHVGIGTGTPLYTLDVQGSGASAGLRIKTSGSSTEFQVQTALGDNILSVNPTSTNNYITNSDFETSLTGWTSSGGATLASGNTGAYSGTLAMDVTTSAFLASGGAQVSTNASLNSGTAYQLSFSAMGGGSFNTLSVTISGITLSTSCTLNSTSVISANTQRYWCTFTPSSTGVATIVISPGTTSTLMYVDAVQVVAGSTQVPYLGLAGLNVDGFINSPTVFSNASNSVTAFQIQNAAATSNLFDADTLNGRIGIGTAAPFATLDVRGSAFINGRHGTLAAPTIDLAVGDNDTGINSASDGLLQFYNNNAESARIDANGHVSINTTSTYTGFFLSVFSASGGVAIFDRGNDGGVVSFASGGTVQGSISIAGATTSYNAFTGSHYTKLLGGAEQMGEVTVNTGVVDHEHGDPKAEAIYGVTPSNAKNQPNVLGNYLALLDPSQPYTNANPYLIMAAGNGTSWVVDQGGGSNISVGDPLITSDVAGYAMKDDASSSVSHIFARAAENIDWSTVTTTINGYKYTSVSVIYGAFDKVNDANQIQPNQGTFSSVQTGTLTADSVQGTTATFNNLNVSGGTKLATLEVTGAATFDSTLTVKGDATFQGNLTVTGLTSVADITVNGHIITAGNTPGAQVLTAAGSSNASVSIDGNDTSGTITLLSGDPTKAATGTAPAINGPTAGDMVTITFNKAYGKAPHILLTPADGKSAPMLVYPSNVSTTGFTVSLANIPLPNTSYSFEYFIVQ